MGLREDQKIQTFVPAQQTRNPGAAFLISKPKNIYKIRVIVCT
jgi:hypothetical protein